VRWLVILLLATRAEAWNVDERDSFVHPSRVTARLDRTTAIFEAHYAFDVKGPTVAGAAAEFTEPPLGLAVAATVGFDGNHRAELVPAHDASEAVDALIALAGGPDRRGMVMLRATERVLSADIAAPHAGRMELAVTYEVPTCLVDDVRYAAVPRKWPGLRAPAVDPDEIERRCGFDGDVVDHDWVGFPARELAEHKPGASRIGVLADAVDTGGEQIARVEVDLASELDVTPPDLTTAIVIDASRSMSPQQLAAQLELVESYLRQAPTSRVQIIAYARTPRPLLPGWMTASHALPRVDRELRALVPRNGSNLDAALASAASWLAHIPGTHRILLMSDELVGERVANVKLDRLVAPGTLVHTIIVDERGTGLARDDTTRFAPLALATFGMPVRIGTGDEPIDAVSLLRPRSFDKLQLEAPGWTHHDFTDRSICQDSLAAGSACAWWVQAGAAAGPLVVEGWLWGKRIRRVMRADQTHARTVARELALRGGLDPEVEKRVDRAARAVNDEWSLVATWGGLQGYADTDNLGRGYGTGRCCSPDRGHLGSVGGRGHVVPNIDLRPQLLPAVEACHASHHRVEIELELTLAEIVDVGVVVVPGLGGESPAALRTMHDCIVERVWDIPLALAVPVDHDTKRIAIGPQ
jgi:von Willebrand factor type A domain